MKLQIGKSYRFLVYPVDLKGKTWYPCQISCGMSIGYITDFSNASHLLNFVDVNGELIGRTSFFSKDLSKLEITGKIKDIRHGRISSAIVLTNFRTKYL